MIATGSKIGLLLTCVGAAVLPTIRTSSAAARAGTAAHREELAPWFRGDPPETDLGRKLRRVEIPEGLRSEAAFALDVTGAGSARLLHYDGERDYSDVAEHEFALTTDGAMPGFVAELKTGKVMVERIRRNAQVLTAALAVWWRWGELPIAILVQAGTGLEPERREQTADELLTHQRRLQRLRARVLDLRQRDVKPHDLVLGDHCRYCPAVMTCPLVTSVIPGNPGEIWSRAVALRARAEIDMQLVQSIVEKDGPVPMPDGGQLKRFVRMRKRLDRRRVQETLAKHFGAKVAIKLCHVEYQVGILAEWANQQTGFGDTQKARRAYFWGLLEEEGALTYDGYAVFETTHRALASARADGEES